MKARRVLAFTLICSMVFGQAVWAAEPQEDIQKEIEMEENIESPADTEENLANSGQTEEEKILMDTDKESSQAVPEESADSIQVQNTEEQALLEEQELPEDAVIFSDTVLKNRILLRNSSVDENGDGYVSKDELSKVTSLDLSPSSVNGDNLSIKSLGGLEYAVNLKYLHLSQNNELTDIDALFELENLYYINLVNTNVSDEGRWRLADFSDMECSKGETISIPYSNLFEEGFSIEILENDGVLKIESQDRNGSIRGLKTGKAKLKIVYKNFSKEVLVIVDGIDYNQETGDVYTGKVDLIEGWQWDEVEAGQTGVALLKENGELWLTYPEPRKISDNAKQCLLTSMLGTKSMVYILDKNNTLWNGEKLLAENVIRFDEYYALDGQNNLKNLHTGEVITNVRDWHVDESNTDGYNLYILRENADLDGRKGSNTKETEQSFEKVKSQVAVLGLKQFLCEDGAAYDYKNLQTPSATGVNSFLDVEDPNILAYYDVNGSLHVWNTNMYTSDDNKYIDLGNINVEQIRSVSSRYGGSYGVTTFILTKENDIYAYKKDIGISKIDSNVKRLADVNMGWIYQKLNGDYYDIESAQGKKIVVSRDEPLLIKSVNRYDAYTGEYYCLKYTKTEEDNIVTKENTFLDGSIEILNHVDKVWRDRGLIYALRTDGTVWDITGVPKMVLDLATNSYVPGDVNEDGAVNIEDLRIILRSVCGKIELTERQIQIADVEPDEKVDIQDLRKVLRFVCGKITEL